eukprot:4701458-Alexandrium_andersonii.AAC.1
MYLYRPAGRCLCLQLLAGVRRTTTRAASLVFCTRALGVLVPGVLPLAFALVRCPLQRRLGLAG